MQRIKKDIPKRRYSGEKWITNHTNKKYLAIDFYNRCAYCDDLDKYNGGYRSYHVEHFAPKEKFKALKYTYENLMYACPYCNGSKSDKWPSSDPKVNVVGTQGFLDPCEEEYYENIYRKEDGSIGYKTELGKYIYESLNLYLKRHKIIYRLTEVNERLDLLKKLIAQKRMSGGKVKKLEALEVELHKEFRLKINELN